MNRANPHKKRRNAVFDTMRLLEKGHIAFHILRNRHDALTFVAAVVGERIEIDVFEDDHVDLSISR